MNHTLSESNSVPEVLASALSEYLTGKNELFSTVSRLFPLLQQTALLAVIGYLGYLIRCFVLVVCGFVSKKLFVTVEIETPDDLFFFVNKFILHSDQHP